MRALRNCLFASIVVLLVFLKMIMKSLRPLFASFHLISLIFVSDALVVPDCISESPYHFGGPSLIDYTRIAFNVRDGNGDLQHIRAYLDAFENNRLAEAMNHLRNVKVKKGLRRSINRTTTPIVSDTHNCYFVCDE